MWAWAYLKRKIRNLAYRGKSSYNRINARNQVCEIPPPSIITANGKVDKALSSGLHLTPLIPGVLTWERLGLGAFKIQSGGYKREGLSSLTACFLLNFILH